MSEPTVELRLEQAQQTIEKLASENEALQKTVERQAKQIEDLREGAVSGIGALPKEVQDDARARMAAGLSQDVAIERALTQYRHNKRLAANAAHYSDAEAAAAPKPAATATPTPKKAKA